MSRAVLISAAVSSARRNQQSLLLSRRASSSKRLLLSQHVNNAKFGSGWTPAPLLLAAPALMVYYWINDTGGFSPRTAWMLADDGSINPGTLSAHMDGANYGRVQSMLDVTAKVKARAEAAIRAGRLVWTALAISVDYQAFDVAKALRRATGGENNPATAEYEKLQEEMWNAQEEQKKSGMEAETLTDPLERALARARSKSWHAAVAVAAKKMAEAEAAGLRAPMSDLHRRSAERLRELCARNGGVYVKLGQHLAQLDFVLPPEFIEVLRCMLDQAPQTPIEGVREVIMEELGEYPETLWRSFDAVPIASASLAQVHRAVGWNGEQLAIKVQHQGLRETSTGDVDAVTLVVGVVDSLFPKFSYKWLADEVERNLPKELDFLHEASNSRKCAAMFEGRSDICVPPVVAEQTTERVLTMRFEPGLRATDVEGMRALGVSLPRVAALISEAFCEQMFRHGSVHCDPHGANVLVRPHPGAKKGSKRPQLVLLDHGLYRELTEQFRVDHCRLWKAMVFKDVPGIKKYCERMNAGEMYHLLAAMLTSRSWDAIEDTSSGMEGLHSKDVETEKGMVRGYVQQYASEIAMLLGKVDRQLLLLLKMNDCLRHIDRTLGAPINTFVIAAKTCIAVLREEDAKEALARLGASKRNFVARGLLYALYYIRAIPEAIKVKAQLLAMDFAERSLERRVRRLR
eukprot:jgi/Undpi1/894/HiC_scaffold_10.g04358.m1